MYKMKKNNPFNVKKLSELRIGDFFLLYETLYNRNPEDSWTIYQASDVAAINHATVCINMQTGTLVNLEDDREVVPISLELQIRFL